ncbi:bifunctional glycoside hydrolase 114/ polysaccharide deacetylase family protein [Acidovorax sp. NCPPB 4044]|uniref:bifunctional glycoside hydrolase 114/ polysaccharide deacetylase family protein n=1 Tax=Acidovorax sp. NCPPB 4044 TaxID=2940490 RepID=UPI003FA41257
MPRRLRSLFFCLCLQLCAAAWAGLPAVALHYGPAAPLAELKVFDIVVVEPDHGYDPRAFAKTGSALYAYVSVAEVQSSRTYFRDIPDTWKMARNGAWNSEVIDQTPADWPEFFATRVVGPLWERGYRGFFLDTLDSYRLAKQFDEAAQQQGLVRVIETLHQRYPGIRLILNRGFEIVPRVKDKVQMVAAESLFRGWNAGTRRYEEVKAADREWLLGQLRTIRERDGLPVMAIDYVPPTDRELSRTTAERIKALGIIPWVTDGHVRTVGVGTVELAPRRVLIVYYGGESPALNYSSAHRFLQMPLNHMGYVVDYADVRNPLPEGILQDRYAGIVTWFSGFLPEARTRTVSQWLLARLAERTPVAVMGNFGFALDRQFNDALGIKGNASPPRGEQQVSTQDPMMGFELAVQPSSGSRFEWVLRNGAPVQQPARALIEHRDARGGSYLGGAILPWGGFVVDPFVVTEVPGTDYARWMVDPFAFLTQSLRLQPLPVPDVTTENGRRLLFSHVDGDGFPSRAELAGSPNAGQVLLKEIFEKYPQVPQTMSVIEAEVAPHGLHPDTSAEMEDIARRMFRLPHVEMASHTYSHPFLWDRSVRHGLFSDNSEAAMSLDVPGYTMDLRREIVGSTEYINSRLAPPDKRVKILLWSGDTAPSAEALEITERAGLLNMNGGDTSITRTNPSLTAIGAHGIQKNGYLQVYAPITNENIYTNLWRGPYYGFEQVLQSFEMTEKPRRIKAVDIYYHVYSTSKRAGLNALRKVYDWAVAQPLHPVFASEYIRKVRDFHTIAIARDGGGWRVRGDGELRTLRLPSALGAPQVAASQGVAGYRGSGEGGVYVHLTGGSAWLRTAEPSSPPAAEGTPQAAAPAPATRPGPYLFEANARIADWSAAADGTRTDFRLQGHAPIAFSLANARGCQVRADQRVLAPERQPAAAGGADVLAYRLSHAAAQIQLQCPGR